MPYLNETGLSYYDPKLKEWISSQPVKTIPSSLYPWTLTDKAGAVTCWPVGGTELLPTVDFMFTETGPASGDKGPSNPSTISGVSEVKVTRCGKNLLEFNKINVTASAGLTGATLEDDGALYVEGTTTGAAYVYFGITGSVPSWAVAGKTYTASITTNYEHCTFGVFTSTTTNSWTSQYNIAPGNFASFQISNDTVRCMFRLQISSGHSTNFRVYLQVEEGTTATAFEPYAGADYAVNLGSTFYGGTIDVASGVMTVTKKYVTITNNISGANALSSGETKVNFRSWPNTWGGEDVVPNEGVSPELPFGGAYYEGNDNFYVSSQGALMIYLAASRLDFSGAVDPSAPTAAEVLAAAKVYCTAHPLHFVLNLVTPYTISLTPTQILSLAQTDKYTPRLNTIYTDAQAVQVGYAKSPIREEFELQQAIVAQGGSI